MWSDKQRRSDKLTTARTTVEDETDHNRGMALATAKPSHILAYRRGSGLPVCHERRLRRDKAAWPHGRSKRAFDLSHQTLAAWPETHRGSAETGGRAADAWRSGARRPDRNAGREQGEPASGFLLLVLAIDVQQNCVGKWSGKTKRLCVYLLLKNNKLRINPRH